MKIEDIKKEIRNNFNLKDNLGVVFSGFSKQKLEFEKGIIFTDKKLEDNLEDLFDKFVKDNKKISVLVIDIVKNTEEIKTIEQLKNVDLLTDGIFVGDIKNDNAGFVLPNTNNIKSVKQAIENIKQKVEFSSKNVNIFKFNTTRFVFEN